MLDKDREKLRAFKNTDTFALFPSVYCHKCRKKKWFTDVEPLSWKCTYCGNTVYYIYGELHQQIDVIAASSARKMDFRTSSDGKSIVAKRNKEVKMLEFKKLFLNGK